MNASRNLWDEVHRGCGGQVSQGTKRGGFLQGPPEPLTDTKEADESPRIWPSSISSQTSQIKALRIRNELGNRQGRKVLRTGVKPAGFKSWLLPACPSDTV